MGEMGQRFLTAQCQLMTVEGQGKRKQWFEHHTNNSCRQDSPKDAKWVGKQGICIV